MDLLQEKQKLRQNIKRRIEALSPDDRVKENADICARLPLLFATSTGVAGYAALPDEVDISPLLHALMERGTPVFLPRYENGIVTFHAVASLEELEQGSLGVREPSRASPQPQPDAISHVLVPGRAFDPDGRRLGRGKGGYDRWIAAQRTGNPSTLCIGIAFREQMVPSVPEDAHDQRMDAVLTADGLVMEDPFTRD